MTDEIDVDVFIGRRVPLKIIEEGGPVRLEGMRLKIA
jgi:hypothetical protein